MKPCIGESSGAVRNRPKERREERGQRGQREQRVSRGDMANLVSAFEPLIKSIAHRYEGRGAEFEDLRQEGYMELVRIARSVGRRRFLKAVSSRLPARVRDAAARMRRPEWCVPISSPDEADGASSACGVADPEEIADGRTSDDFEDMEFLCALEGVVESRDMDVALALAEGESRCEIARRLGVSRSAVDRRVRRIASAAETLLGGAPAKKAK